MKKTTQLKSLLISKQLESIMEAHHALSAKIVEEAGFKGIWGSGLSMSAALGVRDNNEASWTQVLDVLEFMSDVTTIPILLDGDTGYGNFNNARRLVRKLEQRQIAGVCIEDKLFPKTNSFIKGEAQPLADIDEFCGKIKAMKDSQLDDDFVVVARVEAFIAGWGLNEALTRAEAYRKAGADAILVHSKRADMNEIEAFMNEWGDRHPVVIVPTKYYSVPTEKFKELGIRLIIWANHNLRSSIKAMQQTSAQIFHDNSLINVEKEVSPLEEVFRLQDAEELDRAESIYLTTSHLHTNSIILMKNSSNHSILTAQIDQQKQLGIKNMIQTEKNSNELIALYDVKDQIGGNTIISNSDIMYKPYILKELMEDENDITIIVDADIYINGEEKRYVTAEKPYSKLLYDQNVRFISMTKTPVDKIHGEFIGLWKVSEKGAKTVKEALEELFKGENQHELTLIDLFNHLQTSVCIKYIKGSWLDLKSYLKMKEGR